MREPYDRLYRHFADSCICESTYSRLVAWNVYKFLRAFIARSRHLKYKRDRAAHTIWSTKRAHYVVKLNAERRPRSATWRRRKHLIFFFSTVHILSSVPHERVKCAGDYIFKPHKIFSTDFNIFFLPVAVWPHIRSTEIWWSSTLYARLLRISTFIAIAPIYLYFQTE